MGNLEDNKNSSPYLSIFERGGKGEILLAIFYLSVQLKNKEKQMNIKVAKRDRGKTEIFYKLVSIKLSKQKSVFYADILE